MEVSLSINTTFCLKPIENYNASRMTLAILAQMIIRLNYLTIPIDSVELHMFNGRIRCCRSFPCGRSKYSSVVSI